MNIKDAIKEAILKNIRAEVENTVADYLAGFREWRLTKDGRLELYNEVYDENHQRVRKYLGYFMAEQFKDQVVVTWYPKEGNPLRVTAKIEEL